MGEERGGERGCEGINTGIWEWEGGRKGKIKGDNKRATCSITWHTAHETHQTPRSATRTVAPPPHPGKQSRQKPESVPAQLTRSSPAGQLPHPTQDPADKPPQLTRCCPSAQPGHAVHDPADNPTQPVRYWLAPQSDAHAMHLPAERPLHSMRCSPAGHPGQLAHAPGDSAPHSARYCPAAQSGLHCVHDPTDAPPQSARYEPVPQSCGQRKQLGWLLWGW